MTHPAGYGTPKMIDDQGKFSEIHPYDFYQMRRRQPDPASGDWASNDFFFNCFLSALRSLRQDTREYEKPGKMHEWFAWLCVRPKERGVWGRQAGEGQTSERSFSAVSTQSFASKYSLESS